MKQSGANRSLAENSLLSREFAGNFSILGALRGYLAG
jgi:hypothetical protein